MTISLTPEKIEKILHMVRQFLDAESIIIRVVASCIGHLALFSRCTVWAIVLSEFRNL